MSNLLILCAKAFDEDILNDVRFYVILGLLAIALITICVLFAKNDKFKAKEREKLQELDKYVPPEIIKVKNEEK